MARVLFPVPVCLESRIRWKSADTLVRRAILFHTTPPQNYSKFDAVLPSLCCARTPAFIQQLFSTPRHSHLATNTYLLSVGLLAPIKNRSLAEVLDHASYTHHVYK